MNESPENMQNVQNQGQPLPIPNNPDIVNEDKEANMEKMRASYEVRLRKERMDREEEAKRAQKIAKELEDLKKKFESGRATSNETETYITTENKISESVNQGIDPADLPQIIEHHMQMNKLDQTMKLALEKDPELQALWKDPQSPQKISHEELASLAYLPNPAQVFKHLMTNDQDRMLLKAAEVANANGDGGYKYFEFLNNLSNKLKETAVYPHPSNFTPQPSLTDIGESGEFDSESYIRQKYGRGSK